MIRVDLLQRVSDLRAERQAFVLATVVRVAKPASAHAGDSAILLSDGTLEGFVGGMCSESTVRTHGLRQLAAGRSVLLHIMPQQMDAAAADDSARHDSVDQASADRDSEVTVGNPCLSGGALDIFLEVMRPPALVHLYGDTPVARSLCAVGAAAGLDVRATTDNAVPVPPDATAVVVASQGGDEHRVIMAALAAGVPYIGLLASRRRGSALLDALGLDAEQRERVRTPVGLNIGAQSPGEVAVSILAEIIGVTAGISDGIAGHTRHIEPPVTHDPWQEPDVGRADRGKVGQGTGRLAPFSADDPRSQRTLLPLAPPSSRNASQGLAEAIDPVCGMSVVVTNATVSAETQDGPVYFCCPGCRDAFLAGTAG
jgi:xanthine dehydrogenase accessory factor